jgi:hypothetical protein
MKHQIAAVIFAGCTLLSVGCDEQEQAPQPRAGSVVQKKESPFITRLNRVGKAGDKVNLGRDLEGGERHGVFLADSVETAKDYVDAFLANDQIGMLELGTQGRLRLEDYNTQALIIKTDPDKYHLFTFVEVRLLSGDDIARKGWVLNADIR